MSTSFKAIIRSYIEQVRPRSQAELDWFRQQPTLQSAIQYSALAINSNGKRYSHQRRLKLIALERARETLLTNSAAIERARNFDDLFNIIDTILEPIDGLGELYVYDTSLRIGSKLDLLPKKIYLHAGTRDGARALGLESKMRTIEVLSLPSEFQQLEPHEIEDALCIFKDDLKAARISHTGEFTKRSWCG